MQRISIMFTAFITVLLCFSGLIRADQSLQPLTGNEVPTFDVRVVPGPYPPNRDEADLLGERFEVGITYYDYQANGAVSKQIALDEEGNVHVVWMWSGDANNPVGGARGVYYNYVIDDEPQIEGGVSASGDLARAGYANIGYSEQTGAVPIYHAGGEINLFLSFDENLGDGNFSQLMMPNENDNAWFVWPHGTIDRNGRSHTLARWYPLPNEAQPVDPIDLQYNRGSLNEDGEWEFDDPIIAGVSKVLGYTVAASRVSDHVALLYFTPAYDENEWGAWQGVAGVGAANNNIMLIESEDGEEFNFDDQFNITQVIRPDDGVDEDSPFYVGDTLRPYLYLDACYDANENLHVVFSSPILAEEVGNLARRYDEKRNMVWHWDRDSDQFSLVASGIYNVQGNVGAWRSHISYPSIGAAEDGSLYCVFTRYPENDAGANGYVNGEIYASVSTDDGMTWSEAINLTETETRGAQAGECQSEAWCSVAETVDDYLHISYVLDLDPGGIAQGEGVATQNPVMYHRVLAGDIPTEPRIMGMDFHVGFPPEVNIDVNLPQVVAVPDGDAGVLHFEVQNPNGDAGAGGLYLRVTASDELADLVTFESNILRVGPGEAESFTLFFAPIEQGNYEGIILLEHNSPDLESPIELNFNGLGAAGYGSISGTVTDPSDNDSPIAGATVMLLPGDYETFTDDDGFYSFVDVPAWNYTLACEAVDFLPNVREIEVGVDEELNVDISMYYGLLELSNADVDMAIGANERFITRFNASNSGNGSVQYTTDVIAFPDDEPRDPYTMIENFVLTEEIGDRSLQGAVFAGENFYVAGGNNSNPDESFIYVLTREGEKIDSFPQFNASRTGMRDLAYDGRLIWGSDEGIIYGFTTEGELITEFEGPYNPNNGLTWDPVNGLLWVVNRSLEIVSIDMDGNVLQQIDKPEEEPDIYALAYYPFDDDGFPLYLFTRMGDQSRLIWKCNPTTGEYIQLVNFDPPEEGRANGLEITAEYDSHNWVIIGLVDDGSDDAVVVWQLDQRSDWIAIEPAEGSVSVDEPLNINITIDTHSFGEGDELIGTVLFEHDGRGDPIELPVTILVTVDGGLTQRSLDLQFGWNMVSLNLVPETEDIRELTQTLVENGTLLFVKDGHGHFYAPNADDFNNIDGWDYSEGYWFRMSADDHMEVVGEGLATDTPIGMVAGWQLVSYYPREAIDARIALSGIVDNDNLNIAKDGFGHFYIPEYRFSNIGNMREGQGYQINTREEGELTYQTGGDAAALVNDQPQPQHFGSLLPSEENMSILLLNVPETILEVATFNQDILIGSGARREDGMIGIAVWGSNQLNENNPVSLIGWTGTEEIDLDIEWVKGQPLYQTDDFSIGRILDHSNLPNEFALYQSYPNPFNSRAIVRYDLPEATDVSLILYDTAGRTISELVNGYRTAGSYSVAINGSGIASGIYFYRIQAGTYNQIRKTILLK